MNKQSIIFCDTETSGLPKKYISSASDTDNWPRMVQIGWIVYDLNTYVGHKEYIIRPEGYVIPEEVSKVHGITHERALAEGVNLKDVLVEFWEQWASPSDLIVGHNISFDLNIIGAEFYRVFGINPLKNMPYTCTMIEGTDFCNIPGGYGGRPKWPKLFELYQKLFDKPLAQTHTALDDIKNTVDCYFEMVERGIIK